MDVSLPLALSLSRPPLLAHNSWPDFSPLPAVVGLSLMTIHRKGTPLVKIKIRPEAVVNRTHTVGHTPAFNSSTRKNRLLPVAGSLCVNVCFSLANFFHSMNSRNSRTNRDRFFSKFGSNFLLAPRLESIAISYMDAASRIRGSKERKSGGRWKDSLSSLRFVRSFFSSRAFNVNIFREQIGVSLSVSYPVLLLSVGV